METKSHTDLLGKEFDKIVLSVEAKTQCIRAEIYLQGEKVGEVKPKVPAQNYTFYGWQVWDLIKPMVDDGRELCVVFFLDRVNEQAAFDLYQQLCKKLAVDSVGFDRLVAPDRLEINCKRRKKSKD